METESDTSTIAQTAPVEIFEDLHREMRYLLAEAWKQVGNRAVTVLTLEQRMSELGQDIIRWHVGDYLRSNASSEKLFRVIKVADDEFRESHGLPILSDDAVWDKVAPLLITYVDGMIAKYNLQPNIIPLRGFVSFYRKDDWR